VKNKHEKSPEPNIQGFFLTCAYRFSRDAPVQTVCMQVQNFFLLLSRMKQFVFKFAVLLYLLTSAAFFTSCQNASSSRKAAKIKQETAHKNKTKPSSGYSDTLKIDSRSAIFYYPDSLQLERIKAVTDKNVFDGSMHEYFYQFKYVHNELNKYWPGIKIVEAKNVRYLLFIKADKSSEIIDLDTKYDPYGLFIFDPKKNPVPLELTNAPSEIGFYFSD
jgi:hypothetical protein